MTLPVYGLLFAKSSLQTISICLSAFQWFDILVPIKDSDISLVEVSYWINRQTTKEHSLMSKKDSHKKTDLNADQNNQIPLKLNEMDENVSGRFCEWS